MSHQNQINGSPSTKLDRFETSRFGPCQIAHKTDICRFLNGSARTSRELVESSKALCAQLGEPLVVLLKEEGIALFTPDGGAKRLLPGKQLKWAELSERSADPIIEEVILAAKFTETSASDLPSMLRAAMDLLAARNPPQHLRGDEMHADRVSSPSKADSNS